MKLDFIKMHGSGNDFVIIDNRNGLANIAHTIVQDIAHRHLGIGCDQLIVLEKSRLNACTMKIYNSDGTEVEMCGNAARCVAYLMLQESQQSQINIDLKDRTLSCSAIGSKNMITINMGSPNFEWNKIPLQYQVDTLYVPIIVQNFQGQAAVMNIGNPHAVFWIDNFSYIDIENIAPQIEKHKIFINKANVSFIQVINRSNIKIKTWERGVGMTMACGSAACSCVVLSSKRGYVDNEVSVETDIDKLLIKYIDNIIYMSGPVKVVFSGKYET